MGPRFWDLGKHYANVQDHAVRDQYRVCLISQLSRLCSGAPEPAEPVEGVPAFGTWETTKLHNMALGAETAQIP